MVLPQVGREGYKRSSNLPSRDKAHECFVNTTLFQNKELATTENHRINSAAFVGVGVWWI